MDDPRRAHLSFQLLRIWLGRQPWREDQDRKEEAAFGRWPRCCGGEPVRRHRQRRGCRFFQGINQRRLALNGRGNCRQSDGVANFKASHPMLAWRAARARLASADKDRSIARADHLLRFIKSACCIWRASAVVYGAIAALLRSAALGVSLGDARPASHLRARTVPADFDRARAPRRPPRGCARAPVTFRCRNVNRAVERSDVGQPKAFIRLCDSLQRALGRRLARDKHLRCTLHQQRDGSFVCCYPVENAHCGGSSLILGVAASTQCTPASIKVGHTDVGERHRAFAKQCPHNVSKVSQERWTNAVAAARRCSRAPPTLASTITAAAGSAGGSSVGQHVHGDPHKRLANGGQLRTGAKKDGGFGHRHCLHARRFGIGAPGWIVQAERQLAETYRKPQRHGSNAVLDGDRTTPDVRVGPESSRAVHNQD